MKVSVLVAVYNAGKYLSVCLDSLLGQTHRDIEVICIDDASTDESWEILRQYASRDERIILLKQPVNGGQALARNRGLEKATGDFVTMLDSDDWFSPDALELAVAEVSEETDCVLFDLRYHEQATGQEREYDYRTDGRSFTGDEAFRLSLDWSIHGLYMVRREIHQAYPYDTTCRLYSDDNTTRLHYLHSRRVSCCRGIYHYRLHDESMTHKVSMARFQYLCANYSMKQTMEQEGVAEPLMNLYEHHRWLNLVGMYVFYYTHRGAFSPAERQKAKEELRHFYATIEPHRLPKELKHKFGYRYLPSRPQLFEMQAALYTRVRKWAYRLCRKPLPEV